MKISKEDVECARILMKMKYSKKKQKNISKKIFYLNNDKECPVKAGGVLFYKYNNKNELKVLVINKNNRYEDFGGRIESRKDRNIIDTVSREVAEESNNIFQNDYISEELNKLQPIYIKDSKYLLYVIELDKEYSEKSFSDMEYYSKCFRNVEWLLFENFITKSIHPRIRICKNEKFINNFLYHNK
jgi:hypothetical protein